MNTPKRILLVEDEADIADMLRLFFEGSGYEFLHAADGEAALWLAESHTPDLILMDTMLPDIDGFEISRRLRMTPVTEHIPIIFLTRHAGHDQRLRALELGADDFIAKPFDPEELLLRVRNSMDYAEKTHPVEAAAGLSRAALTRQQLANARLDPELAIIEVTIEHSGAYVAFYGEDALKKVQNQLARIVTWALKQVNQPDALVGYTAGDKLALIYYADKAHALADRIASMFNFQVEQFYNQQDREQGYMSHAGRQYPLMQVVCHIETGSHPAQV